MIVIEEEFYSQNLEAYAKDQNIMLPPLYTRLYSKPHQDSGILINVKMPNLDTISILTKLSDTGKDIREHIREKSSIDVEKYLLASQFGTVQDDTVINRMGMKDGADIILVPLSMPGKKNAIPSNSSMRNLNVHIKQPNPLSRSCGHPGLIMRSRSKLSFHK